MNYAFVHSNPDKLFFCWFFSTKKSTVSWKTPKIWFWFKSSIRRFLVVHFWTQSMRTKDQSLINWLWLIMYKLLYFCLISLCTCAHKMGTLVIVTHDLCTYCSLNLLLFRCPKSAKKSRGHVVSSLVTVAFC